MKDERKTKKQLVGELADVRRQLQLQQASQRIRDAALNMEGSKDLPSVTSTFFQEVVGLGVTDPARAEGILIALVDEEEDRVVVHCAKGHVQLLGGTFTREEVQSPRSGERIVLHEVSPEIIAFESSESLSREDRERWLRGDPWKAELVWERGEVERSFKVFGIAAPPDAMEKLLQANEGREVHTFTPFQYGWTNLLTHEEPDEANVAAVRQLTEAFSLGYVRFLDFQRLEEQNRNLEVEQALERVRTQVAAMQESEDLSKVCAVVEEELKGLGVPCHTFGINVVDEAGEALSMYDRATGRMDPRRWRRAEAGESFIGDLTRPFWEYWRQRRTWVRHWPQEHERQRVEWDVEHGYANREQARQRVQALHPDGNWIVDAPFAQGTLGMSRPGSEPFRDDDVRLLERFSEVFSLAYSRYLDLSAIEDAQRQKMASLEEELQVARDMQMGLMPTAAPETAGLSAAGRCVTVNHVGGDFYQYFERDGALIISLADVTGHAMQAAIPAVMFSGVLDTRMEEPKPLPELFRDLNHSLCRSLGEHTFVCLSMVAIDTETRSLKVANCGCPYPLHYHAATGDVTEWRIDAYPLGVRQDTAYRAEEGTVEPGDYLLLYSDGFPAAADAGGDMLGFEHTADVIRQGCSEGLSPEALIERLIAEVKAFTENEPQADDMTCVVVKVEA